MELLNNITEAQLEVIYFLNEFIDGNWYINKKTGLVDIDGSFVCNREKIKDFKGVRFGVVKGSFICSYNKLTSLEGAPQEVKGDFDCSYNELTSLEGAPQEVGGSLTGGGFNCGHNKLTSLVGAPQKVSKYFWCHSNRLTSLEGAPQVVENGLNFFGGSNPISEESLELVWDTMQEKKIDYWTALCILNGQIDSDEWDKMIIGYEDKITPEAIKTYSIASRYSFL